MKKSSRHLGFTLLELLITLAVLAILASLAVPNMSETTKRNAVKAASRNYLGGMSFARNEALSRGKTVTMCPSVDGENCEGVSFDWSNGFIIFIDDGAGSVFGNGAKDSGEEILLAHSNSPNTIISVTDPTNSDSSTNDLPFISWNYQGYVIGDKKAMAVICHQDQEDKFARGLFLELTGRVMSSRDSNNNGIHESIFYSDDGASASIPADLTCS